LWAALIRRIDEVDPFVCPRCGEAMCIVAFITEPKVVDKILRHLETKAAEGRSPPPPRPSTQAACSPGRFALVLPPEHAGALPPNPTTQSSHMLWRCNLAFDGP
jgi:hypothetical protein